MRNFGTGVLTLLLTVGLFATEVGAQQNPPRNNALTGFQRNQGYILLFDGMTMDRWVNKGTTEWQIGEEEAITGKGQLATDTIFGNFQLLIDYWVDEGSEAALYFRAPEAEAPTAENAFKIQLTPAAGAQPGSVAGLLPASSEVPVAGKWNTLDLLVLPNTVTVMLNGTTVADGRLERRLARGPVILEAGGSGNVRFRNIRLLPM